MPQRRRKSSPVRQQNLDALLRRLADDVRNPGGHSLLPVPGPHLKAVYPPLGVQLAHCGDAPVRQRNKAGNQSTFSQLIAREEQPLAVLCTTVVELDLLAIRLVNRKAVPLGAYVLQLQQLIQLALFFDRKRRQVQAWDHSPCTLSSSIAKR